ncbi:root meristem growth factor 10 [Cannabis sativa]|uniref:root meristem growth factor 10 n=1 Tax=Cannabis sativa TaxID=3483 RepID=UPI0029C9D2E5|nr:root meristem growth factor 10 [Cannabis sativa]
MSITCSCILALFLLCLPFHECNARMLLGDVFNKKSNDHDQFSTNHQKDQSVVVEQKEKSTSSNTEADHHQIISTSDDHMISKTKDVMEIRPKELMKKKKGKGSDDDEDYNKKSGVSVSWRVPHKKRGEKQPGFNLDYSPPKTHPPSHN